MSVTLITISFWLSICLVEFQCYLHRHKTIYRKSFVLNDDEVARVGIKEELTTRDDYLESSFYKLSLSGHDLTPLKPAVVQEKLRELEADASEKSGASYLGEGCKGLYTCRIGGLPLFTSGNRIDEKCSAEKLVFDSVCDEEHVTIHEDESFSCIRSGIRVGTVSCLAESGLTQFVVDRKFLRFISLNEPWPIESQPENVWGTEGQYRSWNHHELDGKPLSY